MDTVTRRRFGEVREPAHPGRGLVTVLDFVVVSHARVVAFLTLSCLVFFLAGFFTIPAVDRDEARFAQASKQMVESGELVDIHFQDDVRYKKPIGIYWLQSAAVKAAELAGIPNAQLRIWIYRVPSLMGAIGAVLLTYWAALAFLSRRGAVLAGLLMCSSILLGVEARLAKTDAVLLFTAVATMGAMARVYLTWQRGDDVRQLPWTYAAIFWTAMAGGILIKGPIVPLFAVLAIITLGITDRSVQWVRGLRPLWGLLWLILLVSPWFAAILWRAGDEFLAKSVGDDMMSKVLSAQESHGFFPGAYFLMFWLTFWPGAAMAGMATPAIWRARREPGVQFLLSWVVPGWIVFELFPTKLPHYVLPLYPAIAILIIGALEQHTLSRKPWITRGAAFWFFIPAILSLLAVVGAIMLLHQPLFAAWPFAALAMIFGVTAWWMYDDNRAERSLLNGILASLALSVAVYGLIVPYLTPLFPSVEIARVLRNVDCKRPVAASAGFIEPSLVFTVGTQTILTDASGAADFLGQGDCRFALIDYRLERAFAQRAEDIGLHYSVVTRVDGYNYSQGRDVSIAIFRSDATR